MAADGHEFTSGGAHFEYQRAHRVRALAPSSGPAEGGALVRVAGHGFARRAAVLGYLACRFNRSSAAAAWRGAAEVRCIAPAHAAGVVGVELTQNAQQHTGDGALFEYARALAHSVRPSAGPPRGGTLVEVRGAGFGARGGGARALHCQFGAGAAVRATRASGVLVRCVAPPAAAERGAVPLRVLDGDAVCGGAAAFVYRVAGAVHRVHPLAGGLGGGTLLAVSGSGYGGGGGGGGGAGLGTTASAARCRIGDASVPARRAAAGVLACATPRARTPGYVAVEVAADGHEFTSGGAHFEYFVIPTIHAIVPTKGPSTGGVLVALHGSSFPRRAVLLGSFSCAFNRSLSSTVFTTTSLIYCRTPSSSIGVMQVALSAGHVLSSTTFALFEAYTLRVAAILVSRGSATGTISISVQGAAFRPCMSLGCFCFLASIPWLAHVESSSQLTCNAAVGLTDASSLLLNLDGSEHSVTHHIHSAVSPLIENIHPRGAPLLGGTPVTVVGRDMRRVTACQFGMRKTLAYLRSDSTVFCIAPQASQPDVVGLKLLDNVHGLSSPSKPFVFFIPPTLESIVPSGGPDRGGTIVMLSGSHFSHAASLLSLVACRFNDTNIRANFVSAESVNCAAPQHHPAIVSVEMTNNLLQFTAGGILYTYVSCSIQRAFPSTGPTLGGSRVSISVGGLTPPSVYSSIRCHFGDEVVRACPKSHRPPIASLPVRTSPPHRNGSFVLDHSTYRHCRFSHPLKRPVDSLAGPRQAPEAKQCYG